MNDNENNKEKKIHYRFDLYFNTSKLYLLENLTSRARRYYKILYIPLRIVVRKRNREFKNPIGFPSDIHNVILLSSMVRLDSY